MLNLGPLGKRGKEIAESQYSWDNKIIEYLQQNKSNSFECRKLLGFEPPEIMIFQITELFRYAENRKNLERSTFSLKHSTFPLLYCSFSLIIPWKISFKGLMIENDCLFF